ncbi:hypothetical protein [Streptomyces fungicidicus]|uniref:hypothetical protein n=1 Tax=Streptomyces fungicidicus TaxID=68203 RepID=UPI00365A8EF9
MTRLRNTPANVSPHPRNPFPTAPAHPDPHRTPVAAAEPATGRSTGDASTADRPAENGSRPSRDALAAVAALTRSGPLRPTGDASTADRPAVNGFPRARDALAAAVAPTRPDPHRKAVAAPAHPDPHRTPVAAPEPATGRSTGDGTTGGRPGGSRAVPVGAVS